MYVYNLLFLSTVTIAIVATVLLIGELIGEAVVVLEGRTLRWWSAWPGFTWDVDSIALDWKATPRSDARWAAWADADMEPLPPGLEIEDLDAGATGALDTPEPWRIDSGSIAVGTSLRR